jgi:hypothetical protein
MEYIKLWAEMVARSGFDRRINKFTLAEIIANINKYKYIFDDNHEILTQEQVKNVFHPLLPEPDKPVQKAVEKTDEYNEIIHAFKNSRWIRLGRKLGFLKEIDLK